jgi:hypothetical protein
MMWLRILLAPMRIWKKDQAAGSTHRRKGQHNRLRYEDWYYCGPGRSGAIIITEAERALGLIGCDHVVFGHLTTSPQNGDEARGEDGAAPARKQLTIERRKLKTVATTIVDWLRRGKIANDGQQPHRLPQVDGRK